MTLLLILILPNNSHESGERYSKKTPLDKNQKYKEPFFLLKPTDIFVAYITGRDKIHKPESRHYNV